MGSQKNKPSQAALDARRAADLLTQGMSTTARRQFLASAEGGAQVQAALALAGTIAVRRSEERGLGGTVFGRPTVLQPAALPDALTLACAQVRARAGQEAAAGEAVDALARAARKEDAAALRALLQSDPAAAAAVCRAVADREKTLAEKRALLRLSSLASIMRRFPQVKAFVGRLTLQVTLPSSLGALTRAHWKLSAAQGTTLAHALAAVGVLPRDFTQWKLEDGQGRSVRDVFTARGMWEVHQGKAPDKKTMIHEALLCQKTRG